MKTVSLENLINMGEDKFRQGDIFGAINFFKLSLQKKPGYADALNNLGACHFYLKEYRMAEDLFKKALETEPLNYEASMNLVKLYEIQDRCKLCGSSKVINKYNVQGQYGQCEIGLCGDCSICFLLGSYDSYSEWIIKNSDVRNMAAGLRDRMGNKSPVDLYVAYEEDSKNSFNHYQSIVQRIKITGNILDVGCGNGYFLSFFDEASWYRWGVDYNEENCRKMIKKGGIKSFCGRFHEFRPEILFDVITMLEYIEHSVNPYADLMKAYSMLNDNGLLLIATGNVESEEARIKGNIWPYFTAAPDHKFFFSYETLLAILKKSGFREIALLTKMSEEKLLVMAVKK